MIIGNDDRFRKAIIKWNLRFLLFFTLAYLMLGMCVYNAHSNPLKNTDIIEGDEWKIFLGDEKPELGWNRRGFDDSNWIKGISGFGYGNTRCNTKFPEMRSGFKSIYVRKEFTVNNTSSISKMILTVESDGAFVVYINGIEVIHSKVRMFEELDIIGFAHELIRGKNILCIQAFNDEIDSSDFTFVPTFKLVEE